MNDPLRPSTQPAQRIYDAFQDEAKHREKRALEEWNQCEIIRVWQEARDYAKRNGLRIPSIIQIIEAEKSASGHVDYGAKWAIRVAELLLFSSTRP